MHIDEMLKNTAFYTHTFLNLLVLVRPWRHTSFCLLGCNYPSCVIFQEQDNYHCTCIDGWKCHNDSVCKEGVIFLESYLAHSGWRS